MSEALAKERPSVAEDPLSNVISADVCIVGGGFTGLWTAIELKQRDPSTSVVLLEASMCGAGASGTNAGMLMNLWPKLPTLLRAGGEAEGPALARASVEAIEHVKKFCTEHKIDAQLEPNGWLWASNNDSQDGAWNDTFATAAAYAGSPFIEVDENTATELAGAPVRGGLLDPTCVGLHPARLARGLLAAARTLGVVVHEGSPMTALESKHGATIVRSRGSAAVRAQSVVLALNAWCSELPEIRRRLVMTASDNVVVRPAAAMIDRMRTNVSDAGRLLDYWRVLPDGNVLFGKAGLGLAWGARGASTMFAPVPREQRLVDHMARTIPALAGSQVLSTWRAPVEYSVSSLPFFSELSGHPGVYYGTGYSGDGIGPSVLGARILASLVSGSRDGLSESFLTRPPSGRALPPEPIRFLGGQLVKAAMVRQDADHDRGRRVSAMTDLLTRLDPTSFVG